MENYEIAKRQLLNIDIEKCESFFKKNDYSLELGYCKLLTEDIDSAKIIFSKIANSNPRAHWALRLIQFIEGFVSFLPSYFEIRNFLEIDINLLLKADKISY